MKSAANSYSIDQTAPLMTETDGDSRSNASAPDQWRVTDAGSYPGEGIYRQDFASEMIVSISFKTLSVNILKLNIILTAKPLFLGQDPYGSLSAGHLGRSRDVPFAFSHRTPLTLSTAISLALPCPD
jgi:hypothetical protein